MRLGSRSALDEMVINGAIVRAFAERGLPPPSNDGQFLRMHEAEELVAKMGTPEDDTSNSFTARMLLLLESRTLLRGAAYQKLVKRVIGAYWKHQAGHEHDYLPMLLINDIVRYWRILLLNYAAKNTSDATKSRKNRDLEADRRLRSYKLRFARCLTCYSALALVMARYIEAGRVTTHDALQLVEMAPLKRLQEVASLLPTTKRRVGALQSLYAKFLRQTDASKDDLRARFTRDDYRASRASEGRAFGDGVFDLITQMGRSTRGRQVLRFATV
ncbi:MAG: hypothetical protein IT378_02780 [Sandaracinaceae bacterium]|nr:hypothetical protein [Sandaracinaceae bacterium]